MRHEIAAVLILIASQIPTEARAQAPLSLPRAPAYPYNVLSPGPQSLPGRYAAGRGTYGMTPGADAMSQLGGGYGGCGQYGGYGLTRHEINLIRFQAYETAIQLDRQQWIHRDLTPRWGGVGGIPRWYNGR